MLHVCILILVSFILYLHYLQIRSVFLVQYLLTCMRIRPQQQTCGVAGLDSCIDYGRFLGVSRHREI